MKSISIPTKSKVPEKSKPAETDSIAADEQGGAPNKRKILGEKKKTKKPKSFRFSSLDEERFESFKRQLADSVGDENLSDAKVLKAMLLLTQHAPKSMIKRITDAMM